MTKLFLALMSLFIFVPVVSHAESAVVWAVENDQKTDTGNGIIGDFSVSTVPAINPPISSGSDNQTPFDESFDQSDQNQMSNYVNEPVVEQPATDMDQYTPDSFEQFENNYYDNQSSDSPNDPYIMIISDLKKVKMSVRKELGTPESKPIVLLLFAIAALVQMAKVIAGKSDWISFVTRVLVIFIFLEAFPWLYSATEAYGFQIEQSILGGRSASDILYTMLGTVYHTVANDYDANALQEMAISTINLFTTIFCIASGVVFNLLQSCVLVALYYLGPILIALAIIPETDFTDSYIACFLQTIAWSIIFALLVKIISCSVQITNSGTLSVNSIITLTAMNIAYALATFSIPIITAHILSGKGVSTIASTGMGLVLGGVGMLIGGRSSKSDNRNYSAENNSKGNKSDRSNNGSSYNDGDGSSGRYDSGYNSSERDSKYADSRSSRKGKGNSQIKHTDSGKYSRSKDYHRKEFAEV